MTQPMTMKDGVLSIRLTVQEREVDVVLDLNHRELRYMIGRALSNKGGKSQASGGALVVRVVKP